MYQGVIVLSDAGVCRRLRRLGGTTRACSRPTRNGAWLRRTLPPNLPRPTSRFVVLSSPLIWNGKTRLDLGSHTTTETDEIVRRPRAFFERGLLRLVCEFCWYGSCFVDDRHKSFVIPPKNRCGQCVCLSEDFLQPALLSLSSRSFSARFVYPSRVATPFQHFRFSLMSVCGGRC